MNALVFSSPAHAFQYTVWPRAVATTWSHAGGGLACANAKEEKTVSNTSAPRANARRVLASRIQAPIGVSGMCFEAVSGDKPLAARRRARAAASTGPSFS